MEMRECTFLGFFIHREGNASGCFLVHPDDEARVEAWRSANQIQRQWKRLKHPETGAMLCAFQPLMDGVLARIEHAGIQSGQWCRVTYRAARMRHRMVMRFDRVEPIAEPH